MKTVRKINDSNFSIKENFKITGKSSENEDNFTKPTIRKENFIKFPLTVEIVEEFKKKKNGSAWEIAVSG